MAALLKIKRSAVPGRIPDIESLDLGELAMNTYDGKLYMKKTQGASSTIVEIGAPPTSIGQIGDVDLSNLQNGSLLIYKQPVSRWIASIDLTEQHIEAGQY